jgi:rhodanese-related sulfurtransferase/rubrerythrin
MQWKQLQNSIRNMEPEEAKAYMDDHKEGTFTLLDVRQPGEYEKARIQGAKLIPLPELPDRLGDLDPEKPVIAYCAVGGRSHAAAQLLAGKGFHEVYEIKGGISAWEGRTAAGPAEKGLALLRGDETFREIIVLAYGMEDGLRGFYSAMAKRTDDSEVARVLAKLAGLEEGHKKRLFDLYLTFDPAITDKEAFEADTVSEAMEGGFTTDEFLELNKDAMKTIPDVLNVAMMIETQAMDFYMRCTEKAKGEKSKAVLYDIAEEEKGHLKVLGGLMENKV